MYISTLLLGYSNIKILEPRNDLTFFKNGNVDAQMLKNSSITGLVKKFV